MSECNWPTCGCQNVWGAPWCKATVHPSIIWTVVQPAAAIAALAMRERAADACKNQRDIFWSWPEQSACDECEDAIRALSTTFTNFELLAAAAQLPEVRALLDTADDLLNAITAKNQFGDRSLTITGSTANLEWLIGAEDDTRAVLALFKGDNK
jgi:hypothetical protein